GLFAVGFQASPPPLRTVVVLPEGSNLESQVADLGDDLGRGLDLVGTTTDAEEAMNSLLADEVDLVVVAPDDPAETIRNDEHATIKVYHTTLEPFDRAFITVAARSAVDEINRYVVAQVVDTTRE